MAETTFIGDFKRTFFTGLAALFPVLITLFLLIWLYGLIDRTIGTWANDGCRAVVVRNPGLFETVFPGAPPEAATDLKAREAYAAEHFAKFRLVGLSLGILAVLVFVYLAGFFVRSYVGRRIIRMVDRFFERFPVVKAIYPHARQVADILFGGRDRVRFRHVVAVQYPRRGVYTIGFLTGKGPKSIEDRAGQEFVTVFLPNSPTPLTGFVVVVPRHEVTDLNISVEQAFRFCMTAGMVGLDRPGSFVDEAGAPATSGDVSLAGRLRGALFSGGKNRSAEAK